MKIKHIWSVLCKESVINQDDNNISIHGILEQLSVSLTSAKKSRKTSEKIGVPMNYEVVSLWQKSGKVQVANAEIECVFIDPGSKELLKIKQTIEIPKTSRRFRSRMKITGIPLTINGDYTFQIKIKEKGASSFKLVAELPLEVKINKSRYHQSKKNSN